MPAIPGTGRAMRAYTAARDYVTEYDTKNPHTAGRVRQTLGGILVADGLVGLENPFDQKKSRPGILGSVFLVVFGLIFAGAGWFMVSTAADTDATTTGYITDVGRRSSSGSGSGTCSLAASFTVNGVEYSAHSSVSSSGACRRNVGETIEVRYDSTNPQQNEVGTKTTWFAMAFVIPGLFILLCGVFTFFVRLASIVFGAHLFYTGAKMVKENPAVPGDEGVVEQVRAQFTTLLARRGGASHQAAAPGTPLPGGLLGAAMATLQHNRTPWQAPPPGQPGVPPVGPPVAPPVEPGMAGAPAPGWYRTADGAHERWFDGTAWTAHVRPVPVAPPAQDPPSL